MRGNVQQNIVPKNIEQRLNVEFFVKLWKSEAEINEMLLTVYDEDAMKSAMVYKWVKRFQEGCEDVGNDVWSGHPSSSHTEKNGDRVPVFPLVRIF